MSFHPIPSIFLLTAVLLPLHDTLCGLPPDSIASPLTEGVVAADTTSTIDVLARPGRSPGLAALCSAVVPGTGQIYVGSYWKVPIIVGFGTYFISQWLHYNRLATEARDRYDASLIQTPAGDKLQLALREFYKDQRDTYTWYMVILYLLNVADAYVDASLYDFDVGDDLSVRVLPGEAGRLTVRVEF
jgi:hypothetical protein